MLCCAVCCTEIIVSAQSHLNNVLPELEFTSKYIMSLGSITSYLTVYCIHVTELYYKLAAVQHQSRTKSLTPDMLQTISKLLNYRY